MMALKESFHRDRRAQKIDRARRLDDLTLCESAKIHRSEMKKLQEFNSRIMGELLLIVPNKKKEPIDFDVLESELMKIASCSGDDLILTLSHASQDLRENIIFLASKSGINLISGFSNSSKTVLVLDQKTLNSKILAKFAHDLSLVLSQIDSKNQL